MDPAALGRVGLKHPYAPEPGLNADSWGVPTVAQGINDPAYLCEGAGPIPGPVQWVKVLLQLWHKLQLWLGFDPWPGMAEKEKEREKENQRGFAPPVFGR